MTQQADKPLFVIDADPIIEWPVLVKLLAAGGTFKESQFTVSMHVLSPVEYEKLFAESIATVSAPKGDVAAPGLTESPGVAVKITSAAPKLSVALQDNIPAFKRLITGWSGIKDGAGNDIVFSPEKLVELITGPYGLAMSTGIWRAINEIRFEARLGN